MYPCLMMWYLAHLNIPSPCVRDGLNHLYLPLMSFERSSNPFVTPTSLSRRAIYHLNHPSNGLNPPSHKPREDLNDDKTNLQTVYPYLIVNICLFIDKIFPSSWHIKLRITSASFSEQYECICKFYNCEFWNLQCSKEMRGIIF